jgi:hypothetical protein
VTPVRIDHEIERFAELDQPVHEALGPLVVHVVVAGTVHDQQIAFQVLCEVDR